MSNENNNQFNNEARENHDGQFGHGQKRPYNRPKNYKYKPQHRNSYGRKPMQDRKAPAEGKILYQVIQMDLGQRGIQVETLEMFPAYKRQKSYLLAGILIDDISNYALLYNVHAIKKNGELHRGMDGFCQEKNMVQVPLTVLSEWERIECVDHEIFIVENPSVFALICGEKSCMCWNSLIPPLILSRGIPLVWRYCGRFAAFIVR